MGILFAERIKSYTISMGDLSQEKEAHEFLKRQLVEIAEREARQKFGTRVVKIEHGPLEFRTSPISIYGTFDHAVFMNSTAWVRYGRVRRV